MISCVLGGVTGGRIVNLEVSVRVLGLDPSLTGYGWAIHDTEAKGRKRCPDRGRFKTTAREVFVDRYVWLRGQIRQLVISTGITKVGVEFPIFGELYSEGMYGLFLYTCEALRQEKRDVVFFGPPQTKAHARTFLGRPQKPLKWKMMKPDMIEAAKKDTGGVGRWSSDEADAYWAARAAARFWQFYDKTISEAQLTADEQHQFARIHTFKRGPRAGKTVHTGVLYREDERFFRWSEE